MKLIKSCFCEELFRSIASDLGHEIDGYFYDARTHIEFFGNENEKFYSSAMLCMHLQTLVCTKALNFKLNFCIKKVILENQSKLCQTSVNFCKVSQIY